MKAHEIISRQVVSVTPDSTLVDLANLMLEKRFSGVPVITAKGKLVGMITEGDCMHRVEDRNGKEAVVLALTSCQPRRTRRKLYSRTWPQGF